MPTPELLALSSRLSIGAAQVLRNLTVLPLIDATAPPTGWLRLDQAIGRGVAEISEVSEHGSVPQLRLRNRAGQLLFLLDGEELVGAKQNRILNLSILAPAGSGLEIPVSCVEQGRWSWPLLRHLDYVVRGGASRPRWIVTASPTFRARGVSEHDTDLGHTLFEGRALHDQSPARRRSPQYQARLISFSRFDADHV